MMDNYTSSSPNKRDKDMGPQGNGWHTRNRLGLGLISICSTGLLDYKYSSQGSKTEKKKKESVVV